MKRNTATADFYGKYRDALAGPGAKYTRLRAMLEAALQDGFWGDEGRLPTEHEIARMTGLSLGTIQRALRELVDEGRLVRTPGRGTFVTKAKYHLGEPFVNARFLTDDNSAVVPIDALLVSRGHLVKSGSWTKALNPTDGGVFRVERIFDVNGDFNILHRFYFDPVRFPRFVKLSAKDFRSTNLRGLLARMHHLPVVTHHQTLRFYRFTVETCRLLQCRSGTRGLLESVTATIGDNDAVYFMELFIPPNDRVLQLPDAKLSR
jgi:DNA-binding GntR family transcriptional regulator